MKSSSPLIFDWQAHDRSWLRLLASLALTVAGFATLFIVFRVVTPEARPVDVRPQQVLVLNPSVPAERALIHLAMDRSFALLPDETSITAPGSAVALPRWTPSFARRELRLKPLPSSEEGASRRYRFSSDMEWLPPPAPVPVASPTHRPAAPAQLRLVVEGKAAERLAEPASLRGVALADMMRPCFRIAVGPRGEVLLALPLAASEDAEIQQKLHEAVTRLRFTPAQEPVEWGQVSFRWEAAP